jgi:hypothetical protein
LSFFLPFPATPKHHHDIPSLKQSILDMADKKYNVAIIGYGYVNSSFLLLNDHH